jgi:RhtB (resistance to homoserine/threonine) family protein
MFLSDFLTVLIVGFFIVITPGPNMAIVLRNSLVHSRKAGILTAAGLVAGNAVHITYCLVGIGVLISRSIVAFNIVKWLGAAYLIYLGIKSLMAKSTPVNESVPAVIDSKPFSFIRTGFLTDLLNPKATLFFLALFTQIIRPATSTIERIVYGSSIAILEFVCFMVLAMIIGHSIIRQRINTFLHWIERASGVILIGLGLRIVFLETTK